MGAALSVLMVGTSAGDFWRQGQLAVVAPAPPAQVGQEGGGEGEGQAAEMRAPDITRDMLFISTKAG